MVSFNRMKEDLEELTIQVSGKIPGNKLIWVLLSICILIIFVLGFGIGFGSAPKSASVCDNDDCKIPVYYYVNNRSESCPPLRGERLLTTVREGQSFEGLTVLLQCKGHYIPFPLSVRCMRDKHQALRWSNLPVCHPAGLVSINYWKKTLHARSVTCTGDSYSTECTLHCMMNFVAVEEETYRCHFMPCRAWSIENKKCYMCFENCAELGQHHNPTTGDLLDSLTCDRDCEKIIVSSTGGAGLWQSVRTGLFTFLGEHGGRPVYQKNSTKEYLFYSISRRLNVVAEWIIGPDFTKVHAGIQVMSVDNDNDRCPEKIEGRNITRLYLNSGEPSDVVSLQPQWMKDETIKFDCYRQGSTHVQQCNCNRYEVYLTQHENGTLQDSVEYITGHYIKVPQDQALDLDFLTPLYRNDVKGLFLFSHHPEGLLWQISAKLNLTPIRGISSAPACPEGENIKWEFYNSTTDLHQHVYIQENNIKLRCM